jgi:hypothetical protein
MVVPSRAVDVFTTAYWRANSIRTAHDALLRLLAHSRLRDGRLLMLERYPVHRQGATVAGSTTSRSADASPGMRVVMLVAGPRVRIVSDDGELLRELELDPSKGCQLLGR